MKSQLLCLVLACGWLACSGCFSSEDVKKTTDTKLWLRDLASGVTYLEEHQGETPPTDSDEFWEWCVEQADIFAGNPVATAGASLGKDAWGNDIKILTEQGWLVGLGSKGANGQWDSGHSDDIVILVDERD